MDVRSAAQGSSEQLLAALVLGPRRIDEPVAPLPLGLLRSEGVDLSMHHALGRVDCSGRVSARGLLSELAWEPGDAISARAQDSRVVLARTSTGTYLCRRNGFLVIPLNARQTARIEKGDTVLLSAAPRHDLIIVHSRAALDAMVLADIRRWAGRL